MSSKDKIAGGVTWGCDDMNEGTLHNGVGDARVNGLASEMQTDEETAQCIATLEASRRDARERSRAAAEEATSAVAPVHPDKGGRAASDDVALSTLISPLRSFSLRDAGYVASYTLDDSDVDDGLWAQRNSLSATRLSISLRDSASLRAAVVLNGRSVSPEVARPLLAAYVTAAGAMTADASEYFLDDEYRQNPLEYRPSSQVISLTIAPAGAGK